MLLLLSFFFAVKGYPVIDGLLETTNLTFANFYTPSGCEYSVYAVSNNPLSPDAGHPMYMRSSIKVNASFNSLAFFHEPNPNWIVQEVTYHKIIVNFFLAKIFLWSCKVNKIEQYEILFL